MVHTVGQCPQAPLSSLPLKEENRWGGCQSVYQVPIRQSDNTPANLRPTPTAPPRGSQPVESLDLNTHDRRGRAFLEMSSLRLFFDHPSQAPLGSWLQSSSLPSSICDGSPATRRSTPNFDLLLGHSSPPPQHITASTLDSVPPPAEIVMELILTDFLLSLQ
jgi:hypothetical protein